MVLVYDRHLRDMYLLLVVLLFTQCFVKNTSADPRIRTLYGHKDPPDGNGKTLIINADEEYEYGGNLHRQKRDVADLKPTMPTEKIITKVIDI